MTKDKAYEFLKQVKGKRIKLNCWGEGSYVIPTGKWADRSGDDPYYWEFRCIDENGEKVYWWCVGEGFEESKFGDKWVFVETFDDYLDMYHGDNK